MAHKFASPENKRKVYGWREIVSGLLILSYAGFLAYSAQMGIDGNPKPSLLGLIALVSVGVSVAYTFEKLIKFYFFDK